MIHGENIEQTNHCNHLEHVFGILRKHHMTLSPSKCTFGVMSQAFIGLFVMQYGIYANPKKI